MVDIRVHIDTLEYTRKGLKTRKGINLQVGAHNRVVLIRPDRAPAFATTHGGFGLNSSFPGPPVLSMLLHVHRLGASTGTAPTAGSQKLQLFGHCDDSGTEADNKTLSERRADTVKAWLTADVQTMLGHAHDDSWGPIEQQVMLRCLGCDPGPIDGQLEVLLRLPSLSSRPATTSRPSIRTPPTQILRCTPRSKSTATSGPSRSRLS